MEFLAEYGLFLAKALTVVLALVAVVSVIAASARKTTAAAETLTVEHLNKQYERLGDVVRRSIDGKSLKKTLKARKKADKAARKDAVKPRTFVLDFKGDIRASATASLRQEISAILNVATHDDDVLVRLENPGGTVHEHGLAASQLVRLRERGLKLTVAVDKVAASGGYLMACVADRIIAAPFAIVGSIGVLAQIPNFHRFLKERGVDFEQITAGRFKRTLTVFGENTEEGRDKLKQELEDVHALFRNQISEHRPDVDMEQVATGEYWYAIRALELKLVDELRTSDDFLLKIMATRDVYAVRYRRKKTFPEKLMGGVENSLARLVKTA
jgi:serine protease SohB